MRARQTVSHLPIDLFVAPVPQFVKSRAHLVKALLNGGLELPAISSRTGMDTPHLIWLLSLLEAGELVDLNDLDGDDDVAGQVARVQNPAAESSHFNAGYPFAEDAALGSRICCAKQWDVEPSAV